MKKRYTIAVIIILLINCFITPFINVKATNDMVDILYKNYNVLVSCGKYYKGVYDIDIDYFNKDNPLIVKLKTNLNNYNYKLEIFRPLENIALYTETNSTTNNEMILNYDSKLLPGDYKLKITVNEIDIYNIEFGYYYYNEANINTTYTNNDFILNNNKTYGPDFISANDLIVNKTRLLNEDKINIVLNEFAQFDLAKKYRYDVEYEIFEDGHLTTGKLMSNSNIDLSSPLSINLTNIKESLLLAKKKYTLKVLIYEQFKNDVLFTGRLNYQLYPFLFTDGTIKLSNGKSLFHITDNFHIYSDLITTEIDYNSSTNYTLLTNSIGIIDNKNYYYQITLLNKTNVIKILTPQEQITGLKIKEGIILPNTPNLVYDSIKLEVSETLFTDKSGLISSYTYNLSKISLKDSPLLLKKEANLLMVKENTSLEELKKLVLINNLVYDEKDITFKNLVNDKIATDSIMSISYHNTVISEFNFIVLGDLNSDGLVSMSDVVKLRRHLAGIEVLSSNSSKASDVTLDNNISMSDVVKLRRHLAGIEIL